MAHCVFEKQKPSKSIADELRFETVLRSFTVILLSFKIDLSLTAVSIFLAPIAAEILLRRCSAQKIAADSRKKLLKNNIKPKVVQPALPRITGA
ncbi:hypothetical protein [Flavobacterium johnsoniae]|uniref:hypothetical protein n=1 Tax=Flavobacterium johnsoniae TaxID=986 RepID=UPI0005C50AE3|nr:hypothetical protein [Flavobacterium johnsoniae]OXG00064.1 hypothetical protein B0A63_10175 [Flavobacterium johnsoniae UW101]WQG82528.1 hypothetical protein SR927_05295 [Flavobacterium johnsoniae UW101]